MSDLSLPTAGDWMTTDVLSFSPGDDLFQAIDQLLANHFAAAPVVDSDRRVVGMLTEKDCLRVLANVAYENDLDGGDVSEYLSVIRAVCTPEMDLFRVSDLFLSTNFPLLPVVDETEALCGVISRRDLLRGVCVFREEVNRQFSEREKVAGHQADRPRSIESMQKVAASQSREQMARLYGRR